MPPRSRGIRWGAAVEVPERIRDRGGIAAEAAGRVPGLVWSLAGPSEGIGTVPARLLQKIHFVKGQNMARAVWNDVVIADAPTDEIRTVEGNIYFPAAVVKRQFLQSSETHTKCGWKGVASYYDVVVSEEVNRDAAWYYPDPMDAAKEIAGYIAFWRGVVVEG